MKLEIKKIRIDGGTQCRLVIDQAKVYEYLERMKDGDEFPALDVTHDGASYWLTDGFHRYHAYKLWDAKEIDIKSTQGTLQDARIAALSANSKHGMPLSNEDKRNKVQIALSIAGFEKKSNYEIAKICVVSQPFVAAIRNPEVKKNQKESVEKHYSEKLDKTLLAVGNTNSISSEDEKIDVTTGQNPEEEEIKVSQLSLQSDMEVMNKLLESNEPLKEAHNEIKKLNLLNAQLEVRIKGLMNEKNEAIKMVKNLQGVIKKLKG